MKLLKIGIPIAIVIVIGIYFLYFRDETQSCSQWMWGVIPPKTERQIIDSCDSRTFEVINHEYARDKNHVYFKPTPNTNNETIVLEGADPDSFHLTICSSYAKDKNRVYLFGNIVEDTDPKPFGEYDPDNPQTWCP